MREKEKLSSVSSSCGNELAFVSPQNLSTPSNHDIGALSLVLRKILHRMRFYWINRRLTSTFREAIGEFFARWRQEAKNHCSVSIPFVIGRPKNLGLGILVGPGDMTPA
jgi:hypothetical protein